MTWSDLASTPCQLPAVEAPDLSSCKRIHQAHLSAGRTGDRVAAVGQRAAAAVAAMKGSIEREDLHQMETFSQLKTIRALLQAHAG